jgi:hypothetical protein
MKTRRIKQQTSNPSPRHSGTAPGTIDRPPHDGLEAALSSLTLQHPFQVVAAPYLTKEDKRAILASWASDVWAVVSRPSLRDFPGSEGPVLVTDVLAALRALDDDAEGNFAARSYHEVGQLSDSGREGAEF